MTADGVQPLRGAQLFLAAVLLGLANFMVVLDTTIANVSVPHIAGSLAVSPSQGTWVITSYAVAEAITVPLTGWLAQRFGAVRVFTFGMAGFGVFSFLCGFAPSFGALVAFRVAQGLCGGPIMPMSQTLLLHIFPKEKAPQAIGMWSMTTVVAPIAGPILGGLISDNMHWSWIFYINIPVAAGVGFLAHRLLIAHDTATRRVPVDFVGLALLIVWVGALQVMLDTGKEHEWFASPMIVGLALVAVIGFIAFVIWELTDANPVVNLRVFRHRGFSVGVAVQSLTFGAFFSSVVILPLWLQTSMGYTATWAGYAGCFTGMLAVVMSPIVAGLAQKVDVRALTMFGVLWIGMTSLMRAGFSTDAPFWTIALPQLVMGLGMPFFFISTTSLALGSVDPEETASASGLSNFLRTTGGAFATSLMTTAWADTAAQKRGLLVGEVNGGDAAVQALQSAGLPAQAAQAQVEALVERQAVMLSTNAMFLAAAAVFLFAGLLVWLAPRPRGGPAMGGGH